MFCCDGFYHFFKQGHFVTRIPKRGECYIKPFPIGDEQSIGETKQNMELLQVISLICLIAPVVLINQITNS